MTTRLGSSRANSNNHYVASKGRLAILRHGDSLIRLWTSHFAAGADRGVLRQRFLVVRRKRKTKCPSEHSANPQPSTQFNRPMPPPGEVQAVIFNGLLKYDQNLEITTDLAKSFSAKPNNHHLLSRSQRCLSALLKPQDRTFPLAGMETERRAASRRAACFLNSVSQAWITRERSFPFSTPLTILPSAYRSGWTCRIKQRKRSKRSQRRRTASQIVREWIESSVRI